MFDYTCIDEYQLEITSYCNAACPQCPRNINGQGINPFMPLTHLPRSVIDNAFNKDLCGRLRQVFFCGSYGDPVMHPDFLNILRDFRKKNSKLWLYIHTNGAAHDSEYWAEIAGIMNGYGQIDFGIDGLEDTLHLYRKNCDYHSVIENAQSYIAAGGRAQWNFIVFKHNQHQVEEVQKRAAAMKFYNCLIRKTGRFFNHANVTEMSSWPVLNKQGVPEYFLEPPTDDRYRNRSMIYLPDLKKEYQDLQDYFATTEIRCDALIGKKVTINAEGTVLPCNFFNHNLYDARFYSEVLPGANKLSSVNGQNQVRAFLENYGLDNLNIKNHSLKTIFANKFWTDLTASWSNKNRLFECAMTCGTRLTKVWDQGGSTR
jgi:hypothetical protein